MEHTLPTDLLQRTIDDCLRPYKRLLIPNGSKDICLAPCPSIELTPNRGYTAKAEIPISYKGADIGRINAVIFQPGDGTGSKGLFTLEELTIPPQYQFREKPERVLPRSKLDVYVEVAMPIATVRDTKVYHHRVSLEQLTVDKNTLRRAWYIGTTPQELRAAIVARVGGLPCLQLTTWREKCKKGPEERQEGNPHAVFCPTVIEKEFSWQIVGFLTVKHPQHVLSDHLLKKSINPLEQIRSIVS